MGGRRYFWDLAAREPEGTRIAWGVTANLLLRRTPGTSFALCFPKTGGGEDIAFCLDTCAALRTHGLLGAPGLGASHPWWDNGHFTSLRFWRWACGDGVLSDMYPQYAYRTWLNAVELAVALALLLCVAWVFGGVTGASAAVCLLSTVLALTMSEAGFMLWSALVRDPDTAKEFPGKVCPPPPHTSRLPTHTLAPIL